MNECEEEERENSQCQIIKFIQINKVAKWNLVRRDKTSERSKQNEIILDSTETHHTHMCRCAVHAKQQTTTQTDAVQHTHWTRQHTLHLLCT